MMSRLRSRDATASDEWADRLSQIDSSLMEDVARWQLEEAKLAPDDGSYSSACNTVRASMDAIGRCLRVIRDEAEYAVTRH